MADELATCIALLIGTKIRAEKHISNLWGVSQLDEPDQQVMDRASAGIDEAVEALEIVRKIVLAKELKKEAQTND